MYINITNSKPIRKDKEKRKKEKKTGRRGEHAHPPQICCCFPCASAAVVATTAGAGPCMLVPTSCLFVLVHTCPGVHSYLLSCAGFNLFVYLFVLVHTGSCSFMLVQAHLSACS